MDLIYKILWILCLFCELFSLLFTSYMLCERFGRKKVPFSVAFSKAPLHRYAMLICIISVILIPSFWYYFSYMPSIPDGNYSIEIVVQKPNSVVSYTLPADIILSSDVDYIEPKDGYDIMRQGTTLPLAAYSNECYLYRAYWPNGGCLKFDTTVVPGQETILTDQSSQGGMSKYKVMVPLFTSKDLGVTPLEKLRSISVFRISEICFCSIAAFIGVIIAVKAEKA